MTAELEEPAVCAICHEYTTNWSVCDVCSETVCPEHSKVIDGVEYCTEGRCDDRGGKMKVVINSDYGGFGLSKLALKELAVMKGREVDESNIKRDDPMLVDVVERLGDKANGDWAELKVIEIPDDIEYTIHEYDGFEHIAEKHRTWR